MATPFDPNNIHSFVSRYSNSKNYFRAQRALEEGEARGTNTPPIPPGGVPGHVVTTPTVPEDDDSCQNTGVTDDGVVKSSTTKSIISAALLAYNTMISLKMAQLQRDLGEKYLWLSEEHQRYYEQNYLPLEESMTQEAYNLEKYKRDKDELWAGQMLMSIRGKNAGKIDNSMSCTGRYCTGLRAQMLTESLLEQAMVEATVGGYADRYSDKEEIAHNNLRWEKREQVMKVGRDIPTEAISYATLANGIFGSLGEQAGKGAEGAMSFLAYGRAQTRYPPRRGSIHNPSYTYIPQRLSSPDVSRPAEPERVEKEWHLSG